MKENCARIAIILDRSGSMASVRESTIAGFNEFIRAQRQLPGEVMVKLVQFDDQYDVVFDKPLADVPELTQDLFVPRGMTALFDAQGKTIVALGEELAALPEAQRPSKVIVMTLTDGLESASKEYGVDKIASLVETLGQDRRLPLGLHLPQRVLIRTPFTPAPPWPSRRPNRSPTWPAASRQRVTSSPRPPATSRSAATRGVPAPLRPRRTGQPP